VNKKQIVELLKKQDYLLGIKSNELAFFRQLFDKVREHDYEGFVQIARQNGLDLSAIFKALEDKAAEGLKTGKRLRSYELCLLETMFSDPEQSEETGGPETIQPLEKDKIRELYFLLSASRFGEKYVARLKHCISEWRLEGLRMYILQKGFLKYFNERYHELTGAPEGEYPVEEIIRKTSLPELIEEEKLVEDFVFEEAGGSVRQEGIKEHLIKEQRSRDKAGELLKSLYELCGQSPIDFAGARELMLQLHMQRRVETIEKNGILCLREFLQKNWLAGVTETARRYNLTVPQGLDSGDSEWSLSTVNRSFLNQAPQSSRGIAFLRREGMLAQSNLVPGARCYRLETGYLLLAIAPFQEEEHFIFGQFPSPKEQSLFLSRFLEKYFLTGGIRQAATELVKHYLQVYSGRIRLGNAIRVAAFAFPVVIIAALLIGLLYRLTIGNTTEALIFGGGIVFLGEAIAAKNGYSQKIKPEDQEQIPDYSVREKGVLKPEPLRGGSSKKEKKQSRSRSKKP